MNHRWLSVREDETGMCIGRIWMPFEEGRKWYRVMENIGPIRKCAPILSGNVQSVSNIEIHVIEVREYRDAVGHLEWAAVSTNRPIEVWRKIRGFEEL